VKLGGFEVCGVFFSYEYVRRFLEKCEPDPDSECINWIGYKDRKGYGQVRGPITRGQVCKAHRVSHWIFRGPLMEDETADHICGNPSCVNPYHIRELDRSINTSLGNINQWEDKPPPSPEEEEELIEWLEEI
jgi:hypothetical protein